MNEKNLKPGEIVTYKDIQYKVLENRITEDKKRKKVLLKLNLIGLFTMFAVFIIYIALVSIFDIPKGNTEIFGLNGIYSLLAVFLSFVAFIIVHEYIHYLTYRLIGKTPKDSIKFGVALKSGMAYCISLVPNTVKVSRLSLGMPFYVIVVPLFIISVIYNNSMLAFITALFASGSCGDFWYMQTLKHDNADKYIIEAVPEGSEYEIGYLLLEKIED